MSSLKITLRKWFFIVNKAASPIDICLRQWTAASCFVLHAVTVQEWIAASASLDDGCLWQWIVTALSAPRDDVIRDIF
jgi:hypothetical protein